MSKVLVRNYLGEKTFGYNLPCDYDTASTFCANNLDGLYEIYEVKETIDKGEADGTKVTVTGKNAQGNKHTFSFIAKSTFNEDEIKTALKNKTFNNVRFEEVYIIGLKF
ncbi:hypothetical protein [Campylobacter hyointestinalis]|uniref:hypothetical protein n=1 Tax=Campylobacter hyointestinalis TaxID=198 RepID=UPI000DCE93ED|nr:hypothetical protein [Campylobacter hyointestinalis]RAZ51696.1 hypothetical protein CHL10075_05805 [Campylobacter hyointestinalis subsp. lawsonii]